MTQVPQVPLPSPPIYVPAYQRWKLNQQSTDWKKWAKKSEKNYPYLQNKSGGEGVSFSALFNVAIIFALAGAVLVFAFKPFQGDDNGLGLVHVSDAGESAFVPYPTGTLVTVDVVLVLPSAAVQSQIPVTPESVIVVLTSTQVYPTAAYSLDEYRMTATALAPVITSTSESYQPIIHAEPIIWMSGDSLGCPAYKICVPVPPAREGQ